MSTPIPPLPLLIPWVRVRQEETRIACHCGDRVVNFQGEACRDFIPRLLGLLDGTRSIEEITAALDPEAGPAIGQALLQLAERRLLVNGPKLDGRLDPETRIVSDFLSSNEYMAPTEVLSTLSQAELFIAGDSCIGRTLFQHLSKSGFKRLVHSPQIPHSVEKAASLYIIAPGEGQAQDMEPWNQAALASQQTWLFASPSLGRQAFAGPLFVPPETGCYECFMRRRQSHSFLKDDFSRFDEGLSQYPSPSFITETIASLATLIALRWIITKDPYLPGRCQVLEWNRLGNVSTHLLFRIPRCHACSRAAQDSIASPWGVELLESASS